MATFYPEQLPQLNTEVDQGKDFCHSLLLRMINPIKFELGLGYLTTDYSLFFSKLKSYNKHDSRDCESSF